MNNIETELQMLKEDTNEKHEGKFDNNHNLFHCNYPQRREKEIGKMEMRGWIENIPTTSVIRSTKIPRRDTKTSKELLLFRL